MTAVLVTGATTPVGAAAVAGLLLRPAVRAVLAVGIEEAPVGIPVLDDPRLAYE